MIVVMSWTVVTTVRGMISVTRVIVVMGDSSDGVIVVMRYDY